MCLGERCPFFFLESQQHTALQCTHKAKKRKARTFSLSLSFPTLAASFSLSYNRLLPVCGNCYHLLQIRMVYCLTHKSAPGHFSETRTEERKLSTCTSCRFISESSTVHWKRRIQSKPLLISENGYRLSGHWTLYNSLIH